MKSLLLSFIILVGTGLLFPAYALQDVEKAAEAKLSEVDAVQALAIANQWNGSKQEVKSYVTTKEVVFELPSGKAIKIPLPEDKMVVAVAPYINRTHQ